MNARKIAKLALLAALSVVMTLIHFPLIPPYWEYDAADIPILIGTFLYGPWTGVLLTAVASVVQGMTVSAQSGWVGIVMHILATSTLVLTAGYIYRFFHTRKGALAGLIAGSLAMAAVMIPMNYIFAPFLGMNAETITGYLPFIVLFNVAKAGINSAVTFFVYKGVGKLFREDFGEEHPRPREKKRTS